MVDKTNGVGPITNQTFSKKGVKLSELKENKLLFDYFKKAGLDEHSYVFESDIEKLKEAYDKNENGKLSKKEARAIFGDDASRKELRKAIKGMKEIANTEIKDKLVEVKTGENSYERYDKNGNIISSRINDSQTGAYTEVFFVDGNKEKVSMSKIKDDQDCTVTTTYADGNVNKPEQIIENDKGKVTITDFKYQGDNLVSALRKEGNTITEIEYNKDGTSCATITKPDGTMEVKNYDKDGNLIQDKPVEVVADKPKEEQPKAETATKKLVKAKVNVPEDWGKVPMSTRIHSGVIDTKTADASATKIMEQFKVKEDAIDKEKFVKDLIKYNPSIYDEKGNVKKNAKWDRLDLPNKVAEQYKKADDAKAGKTPDKTPGGTDKQEKPSNNFDELAKRTGVDPKIFTDKNSRNDNGQLKVYVKDKNGNTGWMIADKFDPKEHTLVDDPRTAAKAPKAKTPGNPPPIDSSLDGVPDPKDKFNKPKAPGAETPKADAPKTKEEILEAKHKDVQARRAELEQAFPNTSNQVKIKAGKDGGFVYEYKGETYNTLVDVGRAIDPNYAKPKANAEKAEAKDPVLEAKHKEVQARRAELEQAFPNTSNQVKIKAGKDGGFVYEYKGETYNTLVDVGRAIDPNYAKPKANAEKAENAEKQEAATSARKAIANGRQILENRSSVNPDILKPDATAQAQNADKTNKVAPDPKRVAELRQKLADTRAYVAKQWPEQAANISVKLNKGNVEFDYNGKHYKDYASLNEAIKNEPPVLTKKKEPWEIG